MNNFTKRLISLALILSPLILIACQWQPKAQPADHIPATAPSVVDTTDQTTAITLLAVGDNILHNTVFNAAKTDNGYDFLPLYQPMHDLIAKADIAFVNQEAPMGGSNYAPSSYPTFNSPQEIGGDLVTMGFDIINLANNHMMDKGSKAVSNTLDYLATLDVTTTGAYSSAEQRSQLAVIEKQGISVGFLGYTYSTNGIPIPKDMPYLVALIDTETMESEISQAKKQCDFLVVSMHWGNEYQLKPSAYQTELAQWLNDLGVDLIIGTHPHVLQPAQWLTNDEGHQTFVTYSLGNFISSQNQRNTMLGGALSLIIEKDATGQCRIVNPGVMPLVTHYEQRWKNFTVYPLDQYTDALAKKHRVNTTDATVSPAYFQQLATDILGEFYRTEVDILQCLSQSKTPV